MRKGLVIDTNLLLLFIIGFIDDGRFIKSSNRLSAYSKEDYKILLEIMSQFQTLYITPYIAAEVSNLIDLKHDLYYRAYQTASGLFEQFTDVQVSTKQDSQLPAFITHGIADASLVELAKDHFVLTNDNKLLPLLFDAEPDNIIPFALASNFLGNV